jgi:hypothetical protein
MCALATLEGGMVSEPMNEQTFVAHLSGTTRLWAERWQQKTGNQPLIASGEVEERQVDPATGRVLRCDIRLNAANGKKLASGEMKRPEHPDGRDVRGEPLRKDARRKAIARGLPYYFTCNMAELALYFVSPRPGAQDIEEAHYQLAPVRQSADVEAYKDQIDAVWCRFLDDLETRLRAVETTRPPVTTQDVVALRDAIDAIADEALERTAHAVAADTSLADRIRDEAHAAFGFAVALVPSKKVTFRDELRQILRLGAFAHAQKLVLYRVLSESGPKRREPFKLDPLPSVASLTDPTAVRDALLSAAHHAIRRSKDYETAFNPHPMDDAVFIDPRTREDVSACRVGEVWQMLLDRVSRVSWVAISQNLVGFLYESVVDPEFRHQLGQHYTREDVVDILTTFAIHEPGDLVLDPASGAGSFAVSAYRRKRALGATHEQALSETWASEVTAFAAELTTVALATADTHQPAAYPRALLYDFFLITPGMRTPLQIPGEAEPLKVPTAFDAVVGNPPYISYRRQTEGSQQLVLKALVKDAKALSLPAFSGKSDAYVWFIVHATRFLKNGGRLAFVVSSAILFSDYGIPLIRFLGRHFRILGIVDSIVERWFVDADTNTVLLLLTREENASARRGNDIRFIRLRRPLAQLLPDPANPSRRDALEQFVEELLSSESTTSDPRFQVSLVAQGEEGGLTFVGESGEEAGEEEDES